ERSRFFSGWQIHRMHERTRRTTLGNRPNERKDLADRIPSECRTDGASESRLRGAFQHTQELTSTSRLLGMRLYRRPAPSPRYLTSGWARRLAHPEHG